MKSLGLFENLAFVIMSTRDIIRLIARASFTNLNTKIGLGEHDSPIFSQRQYGTHRFSLFAYLYQMKNDHFKYIIQSIGFVYRF